MSYKPTTKSAPDFITALLDRARWVPGGAPDADDVLLVTMTEEERDRLLDIAYQLRSLEK